jgi:hypothetical protein
MSNLDQKANEVSAEDRGEGSASPVEPGDNHTAPIILFFILGLVASLIVGWVVFPKLLYSQKKQPIDYNHALHNELVDESCESCHYFREDGSFSGVAKLAQCIECHEEVNGESPEEEKFVNEYVAKGREVPWLVYAKQLDCVFFSHAAHVKMADMDCVSCHGHIGESEHMKIYEENRITGYSRDIYGHNIAGTLLPARNPWDRMKMDDCAACHRENNVNQGSVQTHRGGCFVCHR